MENNNIQKASESFGNVPKSSESNFRSFQKENHTLTVRDVLKLFESKGVDITERSIVNYCHPNKHGVCLLDSFFDENERKFYITPQSVEEAIPEIRARKIRMNLLSDNVPKGQESNSESFRSVPNHSEANKQQASNESNEKVRELEKENIDLKITNRGKDLYIEKINEERKDFIKIIEDKSFLIGKLEATLLQLKSPENSPVSDKKSSGYRIIDEADENTTEVKIDS